VFRTISLQLVQILDIEHHFMCIHTERNVNKDTVLSQKVEVAQRVPGRLTPRIFLTFGTTRVVGSQPYAPAAFTPGEIPGTNF